jgi:hypothetical protein
MQYAFEYKDIALLDNYDLDQENWFTDVITYVPTKIYTGLKAIAKGIDDSLEDITAQVDSFNASRYDFELATPDVLTQDIFKKIYNETVPTPMGVEKDLKGLSNVVVTALSINADEFEDVVKTATKQINKYIMESKSTTLTISDVRKDITTLEKEVKNTIKNMSDYIKSTSTIGTVKIGPLVGNVKSVEDTYKLMKKGHSTISPKDLIAMKDLTDKYTAKLTTLTEIIKEGDVTLSKKGLENLVKETEVINNYISLTASTYYLFTELTSTYNEVIEVAKKG